MGKALFFNALPSALSVTGYDRNYNADDISNWLGVIWENGVCKTDTADGGPKGLKVVATSGMTVNVNAGKAAIKGKAFISDALESFTIASNGTTANRYDYVVIKYDNNISVRDIKLELRTGTANIPTASVLNREGNIYELMLAYITVAPSVTSITQASITDTRGDKELCPWFTAVKGYADYYDAVMQTHESTVTLSSASTTVITDLPSNLYNERYSLIEVFTNGLKEPSTAYTVSLSGGYIVITFNTLKSAGAKITAKLDNFIDGEGMSTALAQYNAIMQDVSNLKLVHEYNYICNGINDNVKISEIAQAFANDSTLNDKAQLTINVYGKFGVTAAVGGDGSASSRYQWFNVGTPVGSDKRIIVDFAHCDIINIPLKGNTRNVIFNGYNMRIKNARLIANCNEDNCINSIFATNNGDLKVENCYFESLVTSDVYLSYTGTFINCEAYLRSKTTHAYGFYLMSASKPSIVIGGRYRIYTGNSASGYVSALVYSATAETSAACVLHGVNIPTVAEEGYLQKHAVLIYGGYISSVGLITALPITVASTVNQSITGTIPFSK